MKRLLGLFALMLIASGLITIAFRIFVVLGMAPDYPANTVLNTTFISMVVFGLPVRGLLWLLGK